MAARAIARWLACATRSSLESKCYRDDKEIREDRFVLDYIVRYYARSVEDRDPEEHPSFADYTSGVLWEAERGNGMIPGGDQLDELKKRFPPRKLAGMVGFCWLPPKEYAEYQERLRWRRDRELAWASYQKSVGTLEKGAPQGSSIDELVVVPENVRRAAGIPPEN
jgi:hypothetical protein